VDQADTQLEQAVESSKRQSSQRSQAKDALKKVLDKTSTLSTDE